MFEINLGKYKNYFLFITYQVNKTLAKIENDLARKLVVC
ncbi:conserved hypothetical protein [Capnocytophaga canimorsus]|uniref:Uncharacterized protein n=1 Tax=Capnocytophaga canimorsus TaxID=28188 RepID=A0A0B7IKZ9_9FLAO|nr:conserved hypothetical protein [Capnocytophaga canimorsus]CEN47616.1 conserved hypothetical protein [Capnocytophaga canimorsus]CEN51209.1 conserved hypothetical protein [Capnocytophaga canimorsus]